MDLDDLIDEVNNVVAADQGKPISSQGYSVSQKNGPGHSMPQQSAQMSMMAANQQKF